MSNHPIPIINNKIKLNPADYPGSQRFRDDVNNNHLHQIGLHWLAGNGDNVIDAGEVLVDEAHFDEYKVSEKIPLTFSSELSEVLNGAIAARTKYYVDTFDAIKGAYKISYVKFEDEYKQVTPIGRIFVERAAAELAPLANELYILQNNPKQLPYLKQFLADAKKDKVSEFAKRLVNHTMTDDCPTPFFTDPKDCSLYLVPPDKPAINGMLPWDMTSSDWQLITEAYNKYGEDLKENILRPDTVLDWTDIKRPSDVFYKLSLAKTPEEKDPLLKELVGCVYATPLPLHARFADVSERIVAKALELANLDAVIDGKRVKFADIYPQIAAHLYAVADYFHNGGSFFATKVIKTIIDQSEGDLRLAFTPGFESYWADNTKFAATMWMGAVNKKLETEVMKFFPQSLVTDIDAIAIKETAYKGESDKGVLKFDMIALFCLGGYLRGFPHGTPAAWNLPNYDYEGLNANKFVLGTGLHAKLFNKVYTDAFFGEYAKLVDPNVGLAVFALGHEIGHRVGPTRNYMTSSKSKAAMGSVFGEYWSYADEPKADMNTYTAIKLRLERDEVSLDAAKKAFFAYFSDTFKRTPATKKFEEIKQGHAIGRLAHLGMWFSEGLLRFTTDGKGQPALTFNFKGPDEITKEELMKWLSLGQEWEMKAIDYESRGDVKGYLEFAQDSANLLKDEFLKYVVGLRAKTKQIFPIVDFNMVDTPIFAK